MRGLCPRHPHKEARGRCTACRRLYCARCEFLTDGRLFCGPACARDHQRRRAERPRRAIPFRAIGVAASFAAAIAAAGILRSRLAPARPAGVVRVPERPVIPAAAAVAARTPASPKPSAVAIPPPASSGRVVRAFLPGPPARSRTRPPSPPDSRDGDADKRIVLSFDAGSTDRGAGEILDALRGRGIRTSVFLTGQFIRRYPGLTRRIAADGHEVGNHTFDHPHLTTYALDGRQATRRGVTAEMLRRELDDTASLYRDVTGSEMARLWRAPFGEENDEILAWAASDGYRHVSWTHGSGRNLDALDWVADPESPRYRTSDRVISRLLASARPGNIILMHLGSERDDPVAGHLPRLLDTLASEGYRFSTASELIASGAGAR